MSVNRHPCRRCWVPSRPRRRACGPVRRRGASPVSPSHSARNNETSSPVKHSSITTAAPASPNARAAMNASIAASAASSVAATTTPLPAVSPSAFTTIGAPRRRTNSRAAAASSKRSHCAVGMPAASHSSLVKVLLPSSWAAAREGPMQGIEAASMASAMPATSGASGPGMTRSISLSCANATRAGKSSTPIGTHSANCAMPGLPGAHHSLVSTGLAASAQHSACSRPPDPITRTRMHGSCCKAPAGQTAADLADAARS